MPRSPEKRRWRRPALTCTSFVVPLLVLTVMTMALVYETPLIVAGEKLTSVPEVSGTSSLLTGRSAASSVVEVDTGPKVVSVVLEDGVLGVVVLEVVVLVAVEVEEVDLGA